MYSCEDCGELPDVCKCHSHTTQIEAARNYIIDLEYAVRELKSLCSYYCPEELAKSMSSEVLMIEGALEVAEETYHEKAGQ